MAALTETLAFRKSNIMLAWITEKLELESWQIEETKKAISLTDAGEIATEK